MHPTNTSEVAGSYFRYRLRQASRALNQEEKQKGHSRLPAMARGFASPHDVAFVSPMHTVSSEASVHFLDAQLWVLGGGGSGRPCTHGVAPAVWALLGQKPC